jgi:hypothetical protein
MKPSFCLSLLLITGTFSATLALGNPGMLPQHPGYPMGKATDPVSGQSLANDPGRSNAVGKAALSKSAEFDDSHLSQNLSINDHDQRLLEKPGAGVLPKVQGPNIVVDPPVKEATRVEASPQ